MPRFLTLAVGLLVLLVTGRPLFGEDRLTTIRGTVRSEQPSDAPILIWAMKVPDREDGRVVLPSKQEIFAASVDENIEKVLASKKGTYSLSVEPGNHCLFAFADTNEDGRWDPATPEPFGWYAAKPSGRFDALSVEQSNKAGQGGRSGINFMLRAPRLFPKTVQQTKGGTLCRIKGYPVLQLSGDARTRGLAHGKLLAPQIIDFFRFYVLEDKFRSAQKYQDGFEKFVVSNFDYPNPRFDLSGKIWKVEDQRFVHNRPDVLSFETEELTEDVELTGRIVAHLFASTTGTDADWVVKLIDVYPEDYPAKPEMGGYQLMIADDVLRGKFRNSFTTPEPIEPGKITEYKIDLRTRNHLFRKGHKIMVQVQSTWFPLIDRNPQQFLDIPKAKAEDYQPAQHRIHFSPNHPSHIKLSIVQP